VSNRFDSADLAMQTGLCRQLGIAYPIISAPMGPDISGPDLVAESWRRAQLRLQHAEAARSG
jgi:NAD(P)H-dependent flavin oxidoreductase YrpB (nitropropane dioxygenase family)